MDSIELSNEGFRRASTRDEKVFEAASLFAKGRNGANVLAQAVMMEAFSTSDFPVLLGDAFEKQALKAYKDSTLEFEPLLVDTTVDDFERRKLVDLWGAEAFELVKEGEEYSSADLNETEVDHGAGKYGKNYGLTWELRLRRRFSDLANFPRALANGSIKAQNNVVADLLTDSEAGGWSDDFFDGVDNKPLTPENLDAAIKALSLKVNHRDELVEVNDLVLVHGPGLRGEVNRILTAARLITQVTDGNKTTRTEVDNPFRNIVTPLESRTIGRKLGTKAGGWALLQGKSSDLPSIIRTRLNGHPDVDIRVKRDQGSSVGGGEVSIEEGSFKDDTIWYRGRSVVGIDPAFTVGAYASDAS